MNTESIRNLIHDNLQDAINLIGGHSIKGVKHLDKPLQLIYYGAPGTGKSFTIDQITDESNSIRTTFHPDTDYSTFVGAYKPTMAPMPVNAFVGTTVHHAKYADDKKAYEKKIVYKYVPQAFLKAYVAAWSDLENPHFLIIEEINRGNCAQIFGDLFQLLDRNNQGSSSYAIDADEDIAQFLREDKNGFALKKDGEDKGLSEEQREAIRSFVQVKDSEKTIAVGNDILSGKKLLLPPNLYIWATMNTSDQSLFPIDSAFKRRWNWKYMPIEYNPVDKKTKDPLDWKFQIGDELYSWGQFLSIVNPEIYTLTDSSDKQMGYFFAKADPKTGIISEEVFLNKVLFYLWTDVFKDYDVSSQYFLNKKANRSFRFTDFFEDNEALGNFIENFKIESQDNQENDSDLTGNFSVNGISCDRKNHVAVLAVKAYVESHPDKTAKEVVDDWKKLNIKVSHFIETEAEYNDRKDTKKDRVEYILCNSEKIYISTNGWGDNRPKGAYRLIDLVNALKQTDWEIQIEGVE